VKRIYGKSPTIPIHFQRVSDFFSIKVYRVRDNRKLKCLAWLHSKGSTLVLQGFKYLTLTIAVKYFDTEFITTLKCFLVPAASFTKKNQLIFYWSLKLGFTAKPTIDIFLSGLHIKRLLHDINICPNATFWQDSSSLSCSDLHWFHLLQILALLKHCLVLIKQFSRHFQTFALYPLLLHVSKSLNCSLLITLVNNFCFNIHCK